jgi:hypothetical protein
VDADIGIDEEDAKICAFSECGDTESQHGQMTPGAT